LSREACKSSAPNYIDINSSRRCRVAAALRRRFGGLIRLRGRNDRLCGDGVDVERFAQHAANPEAGDVGVVVAVAIVSVGRGCSD